MKKIMPVILMALFAMVSCNKDKYKIMAVTGATPLAYNEECPGDFSFTVKGQLKKTYTFRSGAINAFASTAVRTRELAPAGEYEGTYYYYGVSLYTILEGIAPDKEGAAFDRPLDMIVTFVSKDGKKSRFSYGELTMADDRDPVVLAYAIREILPTKDPDKYDKNRHHGPLKGLRLICPGDADTARYLDNVKEIVLRAPEPSVKGLPKLQKGLKCDSTGIINVEGDRQKKAGFAGVEEKTIKNWVRVGHGRGYKGVSTIKGHVLRSYIEKNFSSWGRDDFFLFTACDGYRVLFSAAEIFHTDKGKSILLASFFDGKKPKGGTLLVPAEDFFVDRDIRAFTHIIKITPKK